MAHSGEFGEAVVLDVDGYDVRLSSPDRVYFAERGETKLDLAHYYESVGPGIVNALRERPCMLHRFPDGVGGPKVHQKRLPREPAVGGDGAVALPALRPPRRRTLRHPARRRPLGGPDVDGRVPPVEQPADRHREARRVADRPGSDAEAPFPRVRLAADVCRDLLAGFGAVGYPKTSGGRGLHIYVRIRPSTSSATCAGRRSPSPARSSVGCPTM